MGFDPPTHQAWVRIIGLPLQAWTVPRVTEILQRFGHPLHILPFGNEAGHFRDITALVDTKYLHCIPMAYTYREGNYCTQVDIVILAWRPWDETFFPPPGFPPQHGDLQPCPQYFQNPMQSDRHSSSSSTNVPTEPTIDLSSWSARSHHILHSQTHKWEKKLAFTTEEKGKNSTTASQMDNLTLTPSSDLAPPLDGISPFSRTLLTRNITLATKNQQAIFQIEQSVSLWHASLCSVTHASLLSVKHASLLPAPSHFAIKPLSLLCTANIGTNILRKFLPNLQGNLLDATYYLALGKNLGTNEEVHLSIAFNKRGQWSNRSFTHLMETIIYTIESLVKPKTNISFLTQPPAGPQRSQIAQARLDTFTVQMDSDTLELILESSELQDSIMDPAPNQKNLQSTNAFTGPHSSDRLLSPNSTQLVQTQKRTPNNKRKSSATLQTLSERSTTEAPRASPTTSQGGKKKLMATRRSQRIQDQQRTTAVASHSSIKPKSKMNKLPFDLNSHEPPLDTAATLSILQTTGLQINKKIEDMINNAIKIDSMDDNTDKSRPQTPLHDSNPPRIMPENGLIL